MLKQQALQPATPKLAPVDTSGKNPAEGVPSRGFDLRTASIGRLTMSLVPRRTSVPWRTARCKWNATFAVLAPSRPGRAGGSRNRSLFQVNLVTGIPAWKRNLVHVEKTEKERVTCMPTYILTDRQSQTGKQTHMRKTPKERRTNGLAHRSTGSTSTHLYFF